MNIRMQWAAVLAAVGIISSAEAANTVYLTGSTAFRSVVYSALRNSKTAALNPGTVFDANGVNGSLADPTVLSATDNNGANNIVYDGYINGAEYIINCAFTGSEAGIAAVAGSTISNVRVPANYNSNGSPATLTSTYNLPGAPVFFLDPNAIPAYSVVSSSFTQPDLTMADTSQAVSLTKSATLTDFGVVGIVPFVWAKSKSSTASTPYTHFTNVTHSTLLSAMAGAKPVAYFTGVATDVTNNVRLVGRNKGSGTRVNTMLDTQYYPSTPAQYQVWSVYNLNNGVLTFVGPNADGNPGPYADANVKTTPSGDGFESGGFVAQVLECDGAGSTNILFGYLGVGDAKTARDGKGTLANPGGAVWLTLDGNPENNGNVQEGVYSFWGHEHLYGQTTPTPNATAVGNALATGIPGALATSGVNPTAQDTGLPVASMHCDKASAGDSGFPSR